MKLKTHLWKRKQKLKTVTLQWEDEKSSFIAELKTARSPNRDQLKTIAAPGGKGGADSAGTGTESPSSRDL